MKRYRVKVAVPTRDGATSIDEFRSMEADSPELAKRHAIEMAARDESARRYIDHDEAVSDEAIARECRVVLCEELPQ
ncbi:hypothetical protein [Sandaracinus amylolyticus]|uniref:hypothetical protein n=1 Tax=Sandaracinus amylolyticus TaxID=927083 RepID=UPI001F2733F8|nr:hypothetical protein [Sandaracinus amylolyticus]UJR81441.1 Hypothetical protein I5071_35000 [Sandaracinus amylolyticus]